MTDNRPDATSPRLQVLASPAGRNKSSNPYNHLLYTAFPPEIAVSEHRTTRFTSRRWDIFHVHWPDMILRHDKPLRIWWRAQKLLWQMRAVQRRGGKVVWTAHNTMPHHMPRGRLGLRLWERLLKQIDGIIFLSEASRRIVHQRFPFLVDKPGCIIPHGHYRDYYCPAHTPRAQRPADKPDQLLMFGKLALRKEVDTLIDVFLALRDPLLTLTIAGGIGRKTPEEILRGRQSPQLFTHFGHVPDEQIGTLFDAADAVILPYEDVLNSGTAILALSLDRPVIAPAVGSLPDLQSMVGADWMHLYESPLEQQKLESAVEWLRARKDRISPSASPDLAALEWSLIAGKTIAFYDLLLGKR